MDTIKIAFADMWVPFEKEDFITPILKTKYNVVVDQNNPDVLFHSIFNKMRNTPGYKCKKVLILAENWRPSMFGSDYSISFDPRSETNWRLPLWQVYWILWPELKDQLFNKINHDSFERFCSFTVSNPSNFIRNGHFDKLSSYKRVHSYGKVKTNDMGLIKATEGKYWRDAKKQFFIDHPHKFMMTYENTSYPYYCTEKLMDGFLAGSVPLYWGDPKVVEDWNLDSFLNIPKLGGTWLDAIKKVDQDQGLFDAMYNAPVFKDDQKERHLNNIEEFKHWLLNTVVR
jgi:hypothetical protein